ncbi:MAG TPA: hypothetical protein VFH47_08285, partial [Candidatus Thermoplasmatota archaeon]|nr:hypothetical protein [Candidatus Thermoplasmatota archaeon]
MGARYRTPEEGLRALEAHLRRQPAHETLAQGKRFTFRPAGRDFVVTTQDGKARTVGRDEVLGALRRMAGLQRPTAKQLEEVGRNGSYILAVVAAAGLHEGLAQQGERSGARSTAKAAAAAPAPARAA